MADASQAPALPSSGSSLEEKLRSAHQESAEQRATTNRVFISYSRHDGDFVRRLVPALEQRGIDGWVDWEDIPKTAKWREEIATGIAACDSFIFIISPDSIVSGPCGDELQQALTYHKRIVPIVRRGVKPSDCPPEIEQRNWIFLQESDDFDEAVTELVQALSTDLDSVRMHTHLLERAIEWEKGGMDRSLLLRGSNLRAAETWLQNAGHKQPAPTPLQTQYILTSRKAESLRQRIVVGATTVGMVVAIVLAIFALFQRGIAIQRQHEAEQARKQAEARAITAEAGLTRTANLDGLETSTLLSVEALHRLESPEAVGTLRQDLALLAPTLWQRHNILFPPAFDPVAPLVANVSDQTHVQILNARSGSVLRTLTAVRGVNQLLFSPYGKYLVGIYGNGPFSVWRTSDWSRVGTFVGPRVATYRFTALGRYLVAVVDPSFVTASQGTLSTGYAVWDVLHGWKQLARSPAGTRVTALSPSPDGALVAEAFQGRGNPPSGITVLQRSAPAHPVVHLEPGETVSQLIFSPNGEYLEACACVLSRPQNTIDIWDTRNWRRVLHLTDSWGQGVSFTNDGRYMERVDNPPTGSASVEIWSVGAWKRVARLPAPQSLFEVTFSHDGSLLAAAGDDLARVWSVPNGREVLRVLHPFNLVESADFADDTNYLGTTYYDPSTGGAKVSMRVWDVGGGGARQIGGVLATGPGDHLVFTRNSRSLESNWDVPFSHSVSGSVWSVATQRETEHLTVKELCGTAFSPDGAYLLGGLPGRVDVFTVSTGKLLKGLDGPGCPGDMAMNARHTVIAAVDLHHDRQLSIFSFTQRRRIKTMQFPGGATAGISDLVFSPDGRYLAVDYQTFPHNTLVDTLDILDARQGWRVVKVIPHARPISEFSPDGRSLAVSTGQFSLTNRNYAVQILRTGTWASVLSLPHDTQPDDAAFSPDGSFIVTGQSDGVVHVWSRDAAWQEAIRFKLSSTVSALAVSPDGTYIAATGGNRTSLWAWNPQSLVKLACHDAIRNLTHAEWRLFVGSEPYQKTCPALPPGP